MLSRAGFFALLSRAGLGEDPLAGGDIQAAGVDSEHLRSAAPPTLRSRDSNAVMGKNSIFSKEIRGDPVDYLLIKDGWVVPTLVEQTPSC